MMTSIDAIDGAQAPNPHMPHAQAPSRVNTTGRSFRSCFQIITVPDAAPYCADLFQEAFRAPFPSPRIDCGMPVPTPISDWRQCVALYQWSDRVVEPVGFCNYIRIQTAAAAVYLVGGLCVRRDFYARLAKPHFAECKALGGAAQLLLTDIMPVLTDCEAWFACCGDQKANQVAVRTGFAPAGHPYLISRWFVDAPATRRQQTADVLGGFGLF